MESGWRIMDCGRCGKDCDNKTELGYCKTTACTNPKYNGVNVGINETIIFVPSFLDESERNGCRVHTDYMIYSSTDVMLCFTGIGRSFYYKTGCNSSFALDKDIVGDDYGAFVDEIVAEKAKERWRYILLPLDELLAKYLIERGVKFVIACPKPEDRNEWMRRWWKSNATAKQIVDRGKEWDKYLAGDCAKIESLGAPIIYLKSDEWIGNVLSQNPSEAARE
jgi:hypothetical protein